MYRILRIFGLVGVLVNVAVPVTGQEGKVASPADGHTIHVTAPHVVAGKVMGPYHHYCKVLSPEPVIECLCYESSEPGGRALRMGRRPSGLASKRWPSRRGTVGGASSRRPVPSCAGTQTASLAGSSEKTTVEKLEARQERPPSSPSAA